MVLSDGQVHHPPTRKDTLILLVHSDLPDSPWFDAGDHRSLRAPARFFKPDMWTPHVSLSSFTPEAFSVGAFGQSTFSLWAGAFLFEPFSVFSVKPLELFCFITDESLDRNPYNFLMKRYF